MINAEFYKRDGVISGYKIEGHANYAPIGQDIICAAVSSLVIAVTNEIVSGSNIEYCVDSIEIEEIKEVLISDSVEHQVLARCLLNGLLDLSEEHPDNLKVIVNYNPLPNGSKVLNKEQTKIALTKIGIDLDGKTIGSIMVDDVKKIQERTALKL